MAQAQHELVLALEGIGPDADDRAIVGRADQIEFQAARLGRHMLLFHEGHRPQGPPSEPLVFGGFEFSQY